MNKVLFIAPHLSTGGLPQYLCKKIEELLKDYVVYVVEYDDITGGKLVVQRDKLKSLLKDKLFTIKQGENKVKLLSIINKIQPDIIHLEEIPEMFMDYEVAKKIYKEDRKYKIFETSHDSSFDVKNKLFFPDKFVFVSQYQVNLFSKLGIDSEVVEYPIEKKQRQFSKQGIQDHLKFSPGKKHIINVGLFTSRKNQAEIIEYAREMQDQPIHFHFIGNQADNFKWYWEPLMKDFPPNCTWWGERNDVDLFYQAADLFLFTSRGTLNDKETMPLVIREAISWDVPSLIYNLPVYLDYFNKYSNISYLDFNNKPRNKELILEKLGLKKEDPRVIEGIKFEEIHEQKITNTKDVVIISTYPINSSIEKITKDAILSVKPAGLKIILTSHCPISQELQKLVDYVVYDNNNILTTHDFYAKSWFHGDNYYAELNIKGEGNNTYHGPAVYTNYYNGIQLANQLGYKTAYCFNFDMAINDTVIKRFRDLKGSKTGIFNLHQSLEGNTLRTVFHVIDTDYFCFFPIIKNENEYNNWQRRIGSESNGLENIYYHQLKSHIESGDFVLLDNETYYEQFKGCNIDICSQIEYFTLLAVKDQPNKYVIWFSTANKNDNRIFDIYYNNTKFLDKGYITNAIQKYWIMDKKVDEDESIELRLWDNCNGQGYGYNDDYFISAKKIHIIENYDFEKNGFIELK